MVLETPPPPPPEPEPEPEPVKEDDEWGDWGFTTTKKDKKDKKGKKGKKGALIEEVKEEPKVEEPPPSPPEPAAPAEDDGWGAFAKTVRKKKKGKKGKNADPELEPVKELEPETVPMPELEPAVEAPKDSEPVDDWGWGTTTKKKKGKKGKNTDLEPEPSKKEPAPEPEPEPPKVEEPEKPADDREEPAKVEELPPPPPGPVVEERLASGGWGGWGAVSLEKKRGKKSSVFALMPDPPKEDISEVPAIPDTLENKEAPTEDDWMNWASTTTTKKKKGNSEPELPPSPHPRLEPEPQPVVEDPATVQSPDGVEEPKTEEEDEWAMPSWSTKKSRKNASHKSVIGPANAKFDSGYGSMPDAVSESNEQDDDNRSIRSILTNASRVLLPPQQEEHLISAFVGDLCQDIGFCGDLGDARDRISARLPDLLKTFTLRLEGSVNSKTERDAKEFVRQQRE